MQSNHGSFFGGILIGFGLAYVMFTFYVLGSYHKAALFFQPLILSEPPSALELMLNISRTLPMDSEESESTPVKVLCWIMTNPTNHKTKAIHVKRTWGPRCDKLLFMSSQEDPSIDSIALPNVAEGRDYLWAKTKESFKFIYENYFNSSDWFMKADDDTYVVVENLRLMLKDVDPQYPIYFGCKFKPIVKQGYMSGGSGYVLSKEALRRFVEIGLNNKTICREDHAGSEDAEMGKCLEKLGVEAGDTRDSLGRYRFMPLFPEHHLSPQYSYNTSWYGSYMYYPQKQGLECCSDTAIAFHYVTPNQMYVLEYFIYHLKPHATSNSNFRHTTQKSSHE